MKTENNIRVGYLVLEKLERYNKNQEPTPGILEDIKSVYKDEK